MEYKRQCLEKLCITLDAHQVIKVLVAICMRCGFSWRVYGNDGLHVLGAK